MLRSLCLLLGLFLYRRAEGTLDGYKSGSAAARPQAASWVSGLLKLLWWLLRP